MRFKYVCDGAACRRFDLLIGIDKGQVERFGQHTADFGFASPHQADHDNRLFQKVADIFLKFVHCPVYAMNN